MIAIRSSLSKDSLEAIVNKISETLDQEGLQFDCFKALENFQVPAKQSSDPSNSVNALIVKLVALYEKKGTLFQISIIRVIRALHCDEFLKISAENLSQTLEHLNSSIHQDNQYLSKIISGFLHSHIKIYIKAPQFKHTLERFLEMLEVENLDQELLNNIVTIFKLYVAQNQADSSAISAIYAKLKNSAMVNPDQASLLLAAIFSISDERDSFLQSIIDEISSKSSKNICLSFNILAHLGYIRDFSGEGTFIQAIVNDTNSSEPSIKKASISAIAGIFLGNPTSFFPLLESKILLSVENKLYFFQALNTIFGYLDRDALNGQNQSNILDFLTSLISKLEENERLGVFSAIGKLLSLNPALVESKISEFHSKSQKIYQLLICVASRNIFKENIDVTQYPSTLQILVDSTKDADFEVQAAAYATLDSILHYQPQVAAQFDKDFCSRMAISMLFNKANVREVPLGMIVHRIDDSAPVRKVCFSILQR